MVESLSRLLVMYINADSVHSERGAFSSCKIEINCDAGMELISSGNISMKLLDESMGIHSDLGISASSSEIVFGSSIDVMMF